MRACQDGKDKLGYFIARSEKIHKLAVRYNNLPEACLFAADLMHPSSVRIQSFCETYLLEVESLLRHDSVPVGTVLSNVLVFVKHGALVQIRWLKLRNHSLSTILPCEVTSVLKMVASKANMTDFDIVQLF